MVDWGGAIFGSRGDPNRNRWEDADYIRQQTQQNIAAAGGRQAPQAQTAQVGQTVNLDPTQQAQFRQREMTLADQLQQTMNGQRAGAGELAANRQRDQNMSRAYGAATMGRGNNAAGAARSAARAAASIGSDAAGQAQQAAISDQANAGQLLSGVLGQGRSADINIAGQNAAAQNQRIFQQAGIDSSTSLANAELKLKQMGLNDQQVQAMLAQLGQMNQAQMAARGQDNGIFGSLVTGAGQLGAKIFG